MIVLALDTETTGLVESRLMRLEFQPHVIQFAAALLDLETEEVREHLNLLLRPPRMDLLTEKITEITGITAEDLRDAPTFSEMAGVIIPMIERAPVVAAHNLTFDRDVLNVEARRLGKTIAWPRGICTVEQSTHVLGFNSTLTQLHDHLFGLPFEGAHSAGGDVDALSKCLVEMRKRSMI